MSTANKPSDHDYWLKLLLFVCAAISLILGLQAYWGRSLLWDLNPIVQAIVDYSTGLDPYRRQEQSMFIYHPWVLRLLHSISQLMALPTFFSIVYLLICSWFFFESVRLLETVETRLNRFEMIAMATVFGGVTLNALLCGNFSAYFHLVLISLIFNYLNKQRILALYVLGAGLVCFALVKPYFLAYTFFYFLVLLPKRAVFISLACGVALLALWVSGALLFADQYQAFLQALQYQLLAKNDLGGYSTLRVSGPYLSYQLAFLLHVSIVSLVALLIWIRIKQRKLFVDDVKSQALIFILLIIFINPRVVFYDFFVAIFALFYLLLTTKQRGERILLMGFPIAIYAQLAEHSIRWVILAFVVIATLTVYGAISGRSIVKG